MVVVMKNDDCDIVKSVRCFERQNNVSVGNAERANGGGAGYYERQNHVLVRNDERANGGSARYYGGPCFFEK